MQHILGSHEIKRHGHFADTHPKITESAFSFPEFVPTCKKWVYSICSFLEFRILEFHDQTGHTNFWTWPLKKILISFQFLWICINMQKISHSICSFFRHSQLQSPVTRLATPIFDHANLKNFQAPFNWHEFLPACKKSVNSICSFFKYSQL